MYRTLIITRHHHSLLFQLICRYSHPFADAAEQSSVLARNDLWQEESNIRRDYLFYRHLIYACVVYGLCRWRVVLQLTAICYFSALFQQCQSLKLRAHTSSSRLSDMYDNVYYARGHNFRLINQHYTVNCYSNSFVGRTVNAWNSLPASAFDCESVSGFKSFLWLWFVAIFMSVKFFRDVVSCQSADLSFLIAVNFNFVVCLRCC